MAALLAGLSLSTSAEAEPNDKALSPQETGRINGRIEQTIAAYLGVAESAPANSEQALRSSVNAARAMVEAGDQPNALKQLSGVVAALQIKPSGSPEIRVAVADLYRSLVNDLGADPDYRLLALEQLKKAQTEVASNDQAQQAWIWGYEGALYEDEGRFEEALTLTRLAISAAQQAQSEVQLYRWEWQLGRLLAGLGREPDAVAAYERATKSLSGQRSSLLNTEGSFESIVRPMYYQLADLLLGQTLVAGDSASRQTLLERVQQTLETVKAAEVEDYFQERCVVENSSSPNNVADGTAVLYPLVLPERLELILKSGGQLVHVSVPVSRVELIAAVRDFRLNVQVDSATQDYLRLGQKLYGWLIAPLEGQLERANIDTLVFIPDGALRTIPLAALHDGKQFMVERFALATTPGLNLVPGSHTSDAGKKAFASGLSESVQGFSALPSVGAELDAIEDSLPTRVLKDQAFTKQALTRELTRGDYSVVHLATHGQFRGNYTDSFLLTHDDRLQINELGSALLARQFKHGPLDLLVLSACETAAGDDRAALGVAGVAIKSGARTAVASLWEVDDEATKELITAFYRSLSSDSVLSKANHLRAAQRELLNAPELKHPSNWAPFLVIGDWL